MARPPDLELFDIIEKKVIAHREAIGRIPLVDEYVMADDKAHRVVKVVHNLDAEVVTLHVT